MYGIVRLVWFVVILHGDMHLNGRLPIFLSIQREIMLYVCRVPAGMQEHPGGLAHRQELAVMQTTAHHTPILDAGIVLAEFAAIIRHADALEEQETGGDASAAASLDALCEQRAALETLLSQRPATSLADALGMAAIAVGQLDTVLASEMDDAMAVVQRSRDLLASALRCLAAALPADDTGAVASLLRRYIAAN